MITDCKNRKNQYVTQFKKWGWRKNITTAEWDLIDKVLTTRKKKGRESEVYLNNICIPDARVRKEISRHVTLTPSFASGELVVMHALWICLTSEMLVQTPQLSEDIQIRTPPPMIPEKLTTDVELSHTNTSALVQTKQKRSPQYDIEPSSSKVHRRSGIACPETSLFYS